MHWQEVMVITGRQSAEAVSEKLMDLGAGGVAVEDQWDWETAKKAGLGDYFPPAADAGHDNMITIRGYFPLSFLGSKKETELVSFLDGLPDFGLAPAQVMFREVDEADWEQAWKQYWQPTPIGEKLVIMPAWLSENPWPERKVLRLDPGAAFGTGTHETTRLCLEILEKVATEDTTMLDLGCGSGILALAARLLGIKDVMGVDVDEAAIRASLENAKRNDMEDVPFIHADLFAEEGWKELRAADVVTANLTADALLAIKGRIRHVLRPGGLLIASGIVHDRAQEVYEAYQREGYEIHQTRSAGEWQALLLELKV
ncbi:50S ribosomal protein L11 methyltransferase [Dethiobacter alkaliphilus]|uniref:50S ribosomal protein L11 methyltransferase n=1 Tax=Dethiobacter alkaliphilus TaxID=427926 RepID=UPI0022272173|nr:50S ribosomal protein L11 methyltransferase [Dethiobacter alkaliphilus]MCW3489321.1 50S ribosomal protein L11 methyltransferase [Dethiobacter alkaliphilus]